MHWRLLLVMYTAAVATLLPSVRAAADDDGAKELLRRVAENYKGDRYSMQCKSVLIMDIGGMKQVLESSLRFAADGPGRRHLRMSGPFGMLIVSNGDSTWSYLAPMQAYDAEAASPNEDIDDLMLMFGRSVEYFATLEKGKESVRDLGAEAITVDGRTFDCRVIEVAIPFPNPKVVTSPDTLWVDSATYRVARSRSSMAAADKPLKVHSEVTYEKVDFGNAPDSLFVFTAPRGARRVDSEAAAKNLFNSVDLTGKDAVDFDLPDAEGKAVSLSTYRGKVVVVDFWATWCAPCRLALPDLDALQKEFKPRGLIVLAISNEGRIAHELLNKNGYALLSLHDVNGTVSEKYQVKALPTTLVIGKDGKIVAHTTGRRPLSELRDDIKKAGLE